MGTTDYPPKPGRDTNSLNNEYRLLPPMRIMPFYLTKDTAYSSKAVAPKTSRRHTHHGGSDEDLNLYLQDLHAPTLSE